MLAFVLPVATGLGMDVGVEANGTTGLGAAQDVSVENLGMGKCCRCNVGSTYTCLSGPVFDYWTVMNLKEAI